MIALVRISDNMVMDDRQHNDWPAAKKLKIQELQAQIDALQPEDAKKAAEIQAAIDILQADWDAWLLRRRTACAKMFGGVPEDYRTIDVPPEQEADFKSARDMTVSGDVLTIDTRPLYYIEGSVITVTKGWVKLAHKLAEDDITDFSSEILTEPLYFRLVVAQNTQTENISVQLLTRAEDEEFSPLPSPLVLIRIICQGRVNIDNSITEGIF